MEAELAQRVAALSKVLPGFPSGSDGGVLILMVVGSCALFIIVLHVSEPKSVKELRSVFSAILFEIGTLFKCQESCPFL